MSLGSCSEYETNIKRAAYELSKGDSLLGQLLIEVMEVSVQHVINEPYNQGVIEAAKVKARLFIEDNERGIGNRMGCMAGCIESAMNRNVSLTG